MLCREQSVTNIANQDGGVKMLEKMNKYYLILYFRIYLLDLSGLGHDKYPISPSLCSYLPSSHSQLGEGRMVCTM